MFWHPTGAQWDWHACNYCQIQDSKLSSYFRVWDQNSTGGLTGSLKIILLVLHFLVMLLAPLNQNVLWHKGQTKTDRKLIFSLSLPSTGLVEVLSSFERQLDTPTSLSLVTPQAVTKTPVYITLSAKRTGQRIFKLQEKWSQHLFSF